MNRDDLIRHLTGDRRYLHLCAGKATQLSYKFYSPVGDMTFHPDIRIHEGKFYVAEKFGRTRQERDALLLRDEEAWGRYLSDYDEYQESDWNRKYQFEATVRGSRIGSSYAFRMYWLDFTHDGRPDSDVEYALVVPSEEINDKVPKIGNDETILFETFGGTFPRCNNSNGQLRLRKEPKGVQLLDIPQ